MAWHCEVQFPRRNFQSRRRPPKTVSRRMAHIVSLFGRLSIAREICAWLPLIKARHRAHTFLRLRVACRGLLENVTAQIARRCVLHFKMKSSDAVGNIQARRIHESGCLIQFLVSFAKRQWLLGGLERSNSGLPEGMSQRYFDKAVKQHGVLGWRGGCLTL